MQRLIGKPFVLHLLKTRVVNMHQRLVLEAELLDYEALKEKDASDLEAQRLFKMTADFARAENNKQKRQKATSTRKGKYIFEEGVSESASSSTASEHAQ